VGEVCGGGLCVAVRLSQRRVGVSCEGSADVFGLRGGARGLRAGVPAVLVAT